MYRKRVYFREKGAKCKRYRKSANFTKINVKNFANFTEKVLHLQTKSVQKMKIWPYIRLCNMCHFAHLHLSFW